LEPEAEAFTAVVRPEDVVILHDPQTEGLAPYLRSAGAGVIWNCHVGSVDRAEFGSAVTGVLSDPGTVARLGQAGHDSVRDHYLAPVYLMRYLEFSQTVLAGM